jgi:hypothetical protein
MTTAVHDSIYCCDKFYVALCTYYLHSKNPHTDKEYFGIILEREDLEGNKREYFSEIKRCPYCGSSMMHFKR